MKKISKILSLALCILLLFSSLACNKGNQTNGEKGDNKTKPQYTITEPNEHLQTNTLHKVKVVNTEKEFVVNGNSEYKIIIPKGASNHLIEATDFFVKYIGKATEYFIKIETDEDKGWSQTDKYIVFGSEKMFEQANFQMPADDIGQTGYYIKTIGNSVFVKVNTDLGYKRAVLALLDALVGYEMYSEDTVIFEKDGTIFPEIEIIERPDFDYYLVGNYATGETSYGFGLDGEVYIRVNNKMYHNSFEYLPPTVYNNPNDKENYHWKWFSGDNSDSEERIDAKQLCYTAHGDQEEYAKMIDAVMVKLIECIESRPDLANITLTQQDTPTTCQCSHCQANVSKYGVPAASIIMFMNDVDDKLQEYLTNQAQLKGTAKREVNILFFAYHKSEKPPVKLVDGEYVPIDNNVVCNPNVGVLLAPIYAKYNQSFYHNDNYSSAQNVMGWSKCSSKLYMWLYETNYDHYLYPFNTFDTMLETYRFCKENGTFLMYNEGQYNQTNVTAFGKLKEYFNSKAQFNVNVNYNKIVDDFFANYFRDASPFMREYFDELQAHLRYLEEVYPDQVNGNIYNDMEQTRLWPKKKLDYYLGLIEKSYQAIEKYKTTDVELYEILNKHIKLESMFPRFALLRLYSKSYNSIEFESLTKQFKNDCNYFNITMLSEHVTLDNVFTSWGV